MRLVITGFEEGKKIQAIRGFRAAFGADLFTSKQIIDKVAAGGEQPVSLEGLSIGDVECALAAQGVEYRLEHHEVPVTVVVSLLREFSPELTVGSLLEVLERADGLVRSGALTIGGEW